MHTHIIQWNVTCFIGPLIVGSVVFHDAINNADIVFTATINSYKHKIVILRHIPRQLQLVNPLRMLIISLYQRWGHNVTTCQYFTILNARNASFKCIPLVYDL